MEGIDGDDVRVLQAGELLRLREAAGGHFEGHGPVGEVALPRQVDAAEGAAAEVADQLEAGERLAHFRQQRQVVGQPTQQIPSRGCPNCSSGGRECYSERESPQES